MTKFRIFLLLALGVGLGAAGGYQYAQRSPVEREHAGLASSAAAPARLVLYYRDPGGAPFWSSGPKKDHQGRDYLPVYDDEEPSFDAARPKPQSRERRAQNTVLSQSHGPAGYLSSSEEGRNGDGLHPRHEGDEPSDGTTMKVSLDRVQRSGVRTEPAQTRILVQPVRAVGAVAIDERKLTIVTLRSEGYIEDLFVNTTGQTVRAGEPLFRVYSSQIQQAQTDLLVAIGAMQRGTVAGADAERSLSGAMQRLRNLGVPESRIEEVRKTGANPRTLDWPAPANGSVISKRIINGQRVAAGDELYRIADLSTVWVIADVAEADVAMIRPGTRALVTFRAYPTTAGRRASDADLSGGEIRDAHGARAHRAAKSGGAAEGGHVR